MKSRENYLKHKSYFDEYHKENYKCYSLKLNRTKDAEVIEWLKDRSVASVVRGAYELEQEVLKSLYELRKED